MFSVNCIDSRIKIRLLKHFLSYFSFHNYTLKMDFHKSCSAHLWSISWPCTGFLETFHSSKEENCTIELGRPKTAKKARFSYPECGPRHQVPVSASVPIQFRDACPPELRYPGQPDSRASNARGDGP